MSITSVQGPQENHSSPLLHLFFEPEHTIKVFTLVIVRFAGLRIMRITDELFPVILRKPGKSNVCHTKILLRKKSSATKGFKPIVPSSLDILSNRRPAKLSLYDPLRYGVLSSDDRYSICNDLSKDL